MLVGGRFTSYGLVSSYVNGNKKQDCEEDGRDAMKQLVYRQLCGFNTIEWNEEMMRWSRLTIDDVMM